MIKDHKQLCVELEAGIKSPEPENRGFKANPKTYWDVPTYRELAYWDVLTAMTQIHE